MAEVKTERNWTGWITGGFLLLIGLVLSSGGAWLLTLGGSAYYLIAGLLCLGSGVLLCKRDVRGLWLYALLLAGTSIWAFFEVGFDFWQLLPRLAGPAVIGVVLSIPLLVRHFMAHSLSARASSARAGFFIMPSATLFAFLLLAVGYVQTAVYDVPPNFDRSVPSISAGDAAQWMAYGGDGAGTRHSPAQEITLSNVARLEKAWTFETGDTLSKRPEIKSPISFMATPLMIDDRVFLCSPTGKVFALDADTGRQLWVRDPKTRTGNAQMLNCRGVSYHADPAATGMCARRILSTTVDGRLLATDALTGKPCPDFGENGTVDLNKGMGAIDPLTSYTSSPPAIIGTTAVLGSYVRDNFTNKDPSGVVRAFDVKSGALLWGWDSARPDNDPMPAPGEGWTRGSVNAWSVFSADPALGLVYLPTGNATPDHVGTHRSPQLERYASSIVALDVRTGRVRWSFQTVRHDIWDYDMPAQPVLFDYPLEGGAKVPALAAPTKRGEIFILDRRTGKPLTGIEERPVPKGKLQGERYAPTQPYVTGFPSFAPARLKEASMWGATPLDQLWCRIRFRSLDYKGDFTPPSERGMLQYPGTFGALNWGSVSIDPHRQLMIVNASAIPQEVLLFPRGKGSQLPLAKDSHAPGYLPQKGTNYGVSLLPMLSPLGIPCTSPPWGKIAAVDLVKRQIAWQRTLGTTADTAPLGIAIPGAFNLGGTVNTAAGLTFIGATLDNYLRAFDTATGRELWKGRLPASGQATPITYVSRKTGRQYVVIAAGGHMYMGTTPGDYVVAFALPPASRQ